MTSSRRPNNRASSEYAPGPRNISATAIMTTKIVANQESSKFTIGVGNPNSAKQQLPTAISKPAMGVRKPIKSATPMAMTNTLTSLATSGELPKSVKLTNPCARAVTPTVIRSSSSPTPGQPAGNEENDLCTVRLPEVFDLLRANYSLRVRFTVTKRNSPTLASFPTSKVVGAKCERNNSRQCSPQRR